MCALADEKQPAIQDLTTILPSMDRYIHYEEEGRWIDDGLLLVDVEAVFPVLREAANNCPACIMAALRQKGIPVPAIKIFNYQKERMSFFSEVNEKGTTFEDYYW
jgi:hypothetical protein